MAFKKLDPVENGFYQEIGAVNPPGAQAYAVLADTNHNSYTAPDIGTPPDTSRETYKFTEIPADVPGITPVDRVTLFYEPLVVTGETEPGLHVYAMCRLSSTDLFSDDIAPVYDSQRESWTFPLKPGGGAWTVADFQGASRAQFGIKVVADDDNSSIPFDSKLEIEVEYRAIPPNFDAARSIASRILRLRRRICFLYEVGVPLWCLDIELGKNVTMKYKHADDAKGQGWLDRVWERGWLKLIEITLNRKQRTLTHKYFFMREYACLFWDTMVSEQAQGLYGLGAARFHLGGKRTYSRESGAWIKSATGTKRGALYYLATNNVEKVTENGTLIFAQRTNKLFDSSFIRGVLPALTGWTFTPGSGNTIAGEDIPAAGPRLFVEEVGARRVKIVKGAANEANAANTTLTSISNSVNFWIDIGHLDADSGKPLKWAARKVVTGGSTPGTYWWNQAGATWGGAKVWNPTTGKSTDVIVDFYKIPSTANGGGTATVEVMLGFAAADANTTSYGYHAEVIQAEYLSEELIVTTSVAYTVLDDVLSDENNTGSPSESQRIFPATGCTVTVEWMPLWSAADIAAGGVRVLYNNRFDANNYIILFWNKDTTQLILRYRRAGTAYDAVKTLSPVKGTLYTIVNRFVSAAGEEDQTPLNISLFINSIKGTDVVPAAAITMTSTATLWRGSDQGANFIDSFLKNFEVSPEIFSDTEITGFP